MGEPLYDYLGDGAYVKWDGFSVEVLANDHLYPTDRVVLEPECVEALLRFLHRVKHPAIAKYEEGCRG